MSTADRDAVSTPPTTLHDRLRAELERRLAVARAATPGQWEVGGIGDYGWSVHFPRHDGWANMGIETEDNEQGKADAAHIALHDPADAIARYTGEVEVLERHCRADAHPHWPGRGRPHWPPDPACRGCNANFDEEYAVADANDCPEIRSLASRLGVIVDGR